MSGALPPSLERLARSNPVLADDDLGRRPAAQSTLTEIMATVPPPARRRLSMRSHRMVAVATASLLLGTGAAVAATDPFGLWRSSRPDTARYAVDTSNQVRGATPPIVHCAPAAAEPLHCAARQTGQIYARVDGVAAPSEFTRAGLTAALLRAAERGQVTPAAEQRIRSDLAAVSNGFLARLNELMRFGTTGGGETRVPPPGVPMWVVCQPAGAALDCQDLNGDEHVAVGAGVYMALPAHDWAPVPATGSDAAAATDRLITAVLGGPMTAPEQRVLRDLATPAAAQAATSSGGGTPQRTG